MGGIGEEENHNGFPAMSASAVGRPLTRFIDETAFLHVELNPLTQRLS